MQEETEGNLRVFLLMSADVLGLLIGALIVLMQPLSGGLRAGGAEARAPTDSRKCNLCYFLIQSSLQEGGNKEACAGGIKVDGDQRPGLSAAERALTHAQIAHTEALLVFCVGSVCLRGACDTRNHCGRTQEV